MDAQIDFLKIEQDDTRWVQVFSERGLPDPATMEPDEWARAAELVYRWPLYQARHYAEWLAGVLRPVCHRALVAGSVRRGKAEVGDIEIVVETDDGGRQTSAYGQLALGQAAEVTLESTLHELLCAGTLVPRGADGPRLKKFWLAVPNTPLRLKVDLFIVRPPAQWGVILAIRTGPADYSKWLMTLALKKGMKVEHGSLWRFGAAVDTPEEDDFFRALGLACELPEYRVAGKNRMIGEEATE